MDFQPRRLPVFEPVDHKAATSPIIKERKYIAKWNGADCTNGDYSPCEGLGYEEKAITIPKNKSVTYGRSEIWKENVLRNKAILHFTLPLSQNEKHCLQVKAIDKGVILDQLFVFPKTQ